MLPPALVAASPLKVESVPSAGRPGPLRPASAALCRGFTLIELAITLAVMAVLGAIALPSVGASLERQRLHATAQALAADIAEARFEAARRGQSLHVQPTPGAAWCWSVAAEPGCPCGAAQACQLRNVRAADHPGVRLLSAAPLSLDPAGGVQPATAATLESRRGDRLRVDIGPMGRTRICAAAGAWPKVPTC